ncbi:MAG: SMC-Scp complex subunit ScpB [Candidatus Ratteibacteria bacterium]|nr:SMC-Scp complex subunit ScpB [Candidatus Ratteibacteria bacterium]
MESAETKNIIEALLFASSKPLSIRQIKEVLDKTDVQIIRQAVVKLQEEYKGDGRNFQIIEVGGGFRITTLPRFAPWLKKLFSAQKKNIISRQALETLAIIAYKQPITRAEIEAVRGVNADGVTHSLLEKRLIQVVGRKPVPGRPLIYRTTNRFLDSFGLKALADLPEIEELKEVEEDVIRRFASKNRQD